MKATDEIRGQRYKLSESRKATEFQLVSDNSPKRGYPIFKLKNNQFSEIMNTPPILRLTELRLVWGPLDLPDDAVSFADDWEWIIYTPGEMAEALLSVNGVSLLHDSNPAWNKWRAQWRRLDHTIDFDIAASELDPVFGGRSGVSEYWGGSMFRTNCLLEDIMDVWLGIQKTCPAVWLHDTDCRMYNPRSFVADLPGKIAEWSR